MNHPLAGYDRRTRYIILIFIVLFLFIVVAGIAGFSDYFELLPLFLLLGFTPLFIIKRPQNLLFFFIVFLPFQYFIMMVLFGVGHVPSRWITVISAWKEVFVLLVLISLFVQLLLDKKIHFRWSYVDAAMAIFAVYAVIHFFLPDSFFGVKSNIYLRIYGFKSEFFFIFLYFAGRLCSFNQRQVRRIFLLLVGIGVITALLGIFEVSFLNEEVFLKLGYVDYTENHMGIKYKGAFGLAENFWADVGGLRIRRAVSVYMSSQPFAQSYLLIIPFGLALLFNKKIKRKYLLSFGLLIMLVALIMTITRVVIIICFFQILLLAAMLKKYKLTKILAVYAILIIIFALFTPNISNFLERTVSFTGTSEKGHLDAWTKSLRFIKKYPLFGVGIGMGGETSRRFEGLEAGLESEILVYAAEVGIIGLVLYLSIFLGILRIGFKSFQAIRDEWSKNLVISILACGTGILIVSCISHTRGAIFVYYVYWWLAGYLVKVCSETIQPQKGENQIALK